APLRVSSCGASAASAPGPGRGPSARRRDHRSGLARARWCRAPGSSHPYDGSAGWGRGRVATCAFPRVGIRVGAPTQKARLRPPGGFSGASPPAPARRRALPSPRLPPPAVPLPRRLPSATHAAAPPWPSDQSRAEAASSRRQNLSRPFLLCRGRLLRLRGVCPLRQRLAHKPFHHYRKRQVLLLGKRLDLLLKVAAEPDAALSARSLRHS